MTARGELFVNEEIRDFARDEINKKLRRKDDWYIDASKFSDVWDESELPSRDTVPIRCDDTDEIIGELTFNLDFVVEEDMCGRYIEPVIKSIEVKKV